MKKSLIAVSLLLAFGITSAASSSLSNGGFESFGPASGVAQYDYNANASNPWKFTAFPGSTGVINGSTTGFGGAALEGTNFAFLTMNGGTISQQFSDIAGAYTINFSLAASPNGNAGQQRIGVSFDSQSLLASPIQPAADGLWSSYSYTLANVGSGAHTLTFSGLGNSDLYTTAFLDNVAVDITAAVPEPETYAMLLAGLGLMGVVARRRKADKA